MFVTSPALTATVLPDRGGRISSLVDSIGREWLAQPVEPRSTAPAPGTAFVDGDMAGWDECAPSIVACSLGGHTIPDHGDLWATAFERNDDELSATGTSLGYRFARTIVPTARGLRLDYEVRSLGEHLPFLWAAHPQFLAPPGTAVALLGVERVVDVLADGAPTVDLTPQLASIDSVAPGGCRKLYIEPASPIRRAALVRLDGPALELSWSAECPYTGLWFDNRAFSRDPVIAVEPSTGYFDSLEWAVANGTVASVSPAAPLRWWVELSVVDCLVGSGCSTP